MVYKSIINQIPTYQFLVCKENLISIADVLNNQQISWKYSFASNLTTGEQGLCNSITKLSSLQTFWF